MCFSLISDTLRVALYRQDGSAGGGSLLPGGGGGRGLEGRLPSKLVPGARWAEMSDLTPLQLVFPLPFYWIVFKF